MVSSMKDAFERAVKLKEESADEEKKLQLKDPLRQIIMVSVSESNARSGKHSCHDKKRPRNEGERNVKVTYGHVKPRAPRGKQQATQPEPSVVKITKVQTPKPTYAQSASVPPVVPPAPAPRPMHIITVSGAPAFALKFSDLKTDQLFSEVESSVPLTQLHAGKIVDEREVVLGLDFGTSCVKVVIGDAALGKSFAVPFCKSEGIERFLLPSRLYQTGGTFSLNAGSHVYRDLKLSLLANPDDSILQQRIVAFLALVILRTRGWLLTEHAATYNRTQIVWKLAVGIPSAQHIQTPLSKLFERLGLAAWIVAGASADVSESLIQSVLDQNPLPGQKNDDVEINVVPEIAAQIYGFVASSSFDMKAPNIYLMADVGAGTVDSALFHVKRGKGGRWDFEFFTSVVEPNGVSNLHRHRVNWWNEELMKLNTPQQVLDDLNASKLITDQQILTPESFLDYFDGIQVNFEDPLKTPDESFFNNRVLAQVQGKSFWRTWKDNLLLQTDLTNIPFFMCGGGMRMDFYKALAPRLASIPGCTWLKAECRILGAPADLVAEGIVEEDYDRLSVAYGLSRLEVGRIVKAVPQPKLNVPFVDSWRDNYIDKDQC